MPIDDSNNVNNRELTINIVTNNKRRDIIVK